jgi:L-lactate dehydrogenase complex protein LldG
MVSMNDSMVQKFKKKHESLAGIVHLVDGLDAAADKIYAILEAKKAAKVAITELPFEIGQSIEQRCESAGMNLLKPPFDGVDLPAEFDSIDVGITWAAFAIAETGSLVEFATNDSFRLISALPLVHIGVFQAADIIESLSEAAVPVRNFYQENPLNATVSFISGPSRTADIEMRLILGVHGPAETHAIIVN